MQEVRRTPKRYLFTPPPPPPSSYQVCEPRHLIHIVIHFHLQQVTIDACWAFSYLSDGPSEVVNAVMASGVIPVFASYLTCAEPAIVTPALRTLGNIVTGSDAQTQVGFWDLSVFLLVWAMTGVTDS